MNCEELDAGTFRQWLATRHEQIDCGELVYIAHQMDFLARKSPVQVILKQGAPFLV